jgi:hypothetical protein
MQHAKTLPIESSIILVRGQRVILAADLARIYGVETRVLNQAVKRNIQRFPDDFVFRVSPKEAKNIFRSRSQSVILKRGQNIKYLPMPLRNTVRLWQPMLLIVLARCR